MRAMRSPPSVMSSMISGSELRFEKSGAMLTLVRLQKTWRLGGSSHSALERPHEEGLERQPRPERHRDAERAARGPAREAALEDEEHRRRRHVSVGGEHFERRRHGLLAEADLLRDRLDDPAAARMDGPETDVSAR